MIVSCNVCPTGAFCIFFALFLFEVNDNNDRDRTKNLRATMCTMVKVGTRGMLGRLLPTVQVPPLKKEGHITTVKKSFLY